MAFAGVREPLRGARRVAARRRHRGAVALAAQGARERRRVLELARRRARQAQRVAPPAPVTALASNISANVSARVSGLYRPDDEPAGGRHGVAVVRGCRLSAVKVERGAVVRRAPAVHVAARVVLHHRAHRARRADRGRAPTRSVQARIAEHRLQLPHGRPFNRRHLKKFASSSHL